MFDTKELALLHSTIQAERKTISGGNWLKVDQNYHEQLLEEDQEYRDLYELEVKLEKIIKGEL